MTKPKKLEPLRKFTYSLEQAKIDSKNGAFLTPATYYFLTKILNFMMDHITALEEKNDYQAS